MSALNHSDKDKAIERLLLEVSHKVPFYRRIGATYLTDLPPIGKHFISQNIPDFLCDVGLVQRDALLDIMLNFKQNRTARYFRAIEDIIIEQTTGTTGVPLRVPKRLAERNNLSVGIWGHRKSILGDLKLLQFRSLTSFAPNITLSLANDRVSSIYSTNPNDILAIYTELFRLNTRWLHISPVLLCRHIALLKLSGCMSVRGLIEIIETTGLPLYAKQREEIQSFFGAAIYEQYGCVETWAIGYNNPGDISYDILDSNVIVELIALNSDTVVTSPGEIGRVTLTSLKQFLFPIIRYITGDLAQWQVTSDGKRRLRLEEDRLRNMLCVANSLIPAQNLFRQITGKALADYGHFNLAYIQYVQITPTVIEIHYESSNPAHLFAKYLVSRLTKLCLGNTRHQWTLKPTIDFNSAMTASDKFYIFKSVVTVEEYQQYKFNASLGLEILEQIETSF